MKLPRITFWRVIAACILAAGMYASVLRFFFGLGAATNLTDQFPWGLWIGFDVLVGVGLAAGGFTIAATVHIFNLEKYEPISRPSLLTAFLGYLLVTAGLVFDIGRPFRLWHPLIMWNPHSVMFEVAWCVTLYTTVLALEFSPIVFERFNLKVPLRLVRAIYLPLVIMGVILSTLHQSSLGTVYLIVPDKLHPLWYTPVLPIFFFITAIAAGLAMTIVESFLSARAFGKQLEHEIIQGLSRVAVVVLSVYAIWKFQDLARRDALQYAFQYSPESVLFWAELGLGAIVPVVILFLSVNRASPARLFFCALLVVLGFILNRLNVSITGMLHSDTYIPRWAELAVTLSFVVGGFIVFNLAVRNFPIFTHEGEPGLDEGPGERVPSLPARAVMALWVVAVVVIAGFLLARNGEQSVAAAEPALQSETGAEQEFKNLPGDLKISRHENSPGQVTFSHSSHLALQDKPSCTGCHPQPFSFKVGEGSAPAPEAWHKSCATCHNGNSASNIEEACDSCHISE